MIRPSVSVVIPTRNRSQLLPVALRALSQQQGDTPHEVIVVDNNSTDDTRGVVEGFRTAVASPLHYVFESRTGVSNARNAGIATARAPVIAFADDDVHVEPHWVERIHALSERHPGVECFGGKVLPVWSAPPPAWLDRRHWSPLALTDYGDVPFTVSAARPLCLISANLAVRRRAFERVGGFSPEFPRAQDHEWLLRLWHAGGVGLYDPSLVVWADVPADRLTRRYHRRWHLQHGRFSARMQLRERTDSTGRLRTGSLPEFRQCAGVPRFLFRVLAHDCLTTLRLAISGGPRAETLAHLYAAYDVCGGIADRASRWWAGARQRPAESRDSGKRRLDGCL
jgi:glucosyl-dolichyl phosphate glucuronosyltransferase